jgi:hypothetical protein
MPVAVVTGLWNNQNTNDDVFEAYPNPFSEYISLKFNSPTLDKISIQISDVRGVGFYSSVNEYSTNEIIKVGKDLPVGVFMVQVSYKEKVKVFKIVKVE